MEPKVKNFFVKISNFLKISRIIHFIYLIIAPCCFIVKTGLPNMNKMFFSVKKNNLPDIYLFVCFPFIVIFFSEALLSFTSVGSPYQSFLIFFKPPGQSRYQMKSRSTKRIRRETGIAAHTPSIENQSGRMKRQSGSATNPSPYIRSEDFAICSVDW